MKNYFRLIKATILLLSCIIHLSICENAKDADPPCTSLEDNNRVCLTKQELSKKGLGVLRAFMKGGDPCFLGLKKKRVCVVSTALDKGNFFAPCSCAVKKCGCETEKLKNKNSTKITFNFNSDKISETTAETKDTTCRSNIPGSNKKCLIKDEVGPLSSRMIGGNPCFQAIKNEGICFVSKDGKLETCSCSNKSCGCQDVADKKPQPKITQSTSSQKIGVQKQKDTKPIASGNKICKSANFGSNKRCLHKEEVGSFADFMQAGDPCFLRKNKRWCFVTKSGSMEPCSCKYEECGCKDKSKAIPSPKCDGSTIPKTVDTCKTKYCKSPYTTRQNNNHTVCKYCGIGKLCGSSICQYSLTDTDKQLIVTKHNELRSLVAQGLESRGVGGKGQPRASNMKKMSWNEDLAEVAQTWVNQCLGEDSIYHDDNRRTSAFRYAGQNYASKSHSANLGEKFLAGMIQDLYDEVKDFPFRNVEPFNIRRNVTGDVGHYTQIAWADTHKVGCGYIMYKKGTWYHKVLVCNYGPGGNIVGGRMYAVGKPGSLCSNGSEKGLCL